MVVDTTVWIDFLGAKATPFDIHLSDLIQRGESLALTDVIYCEILQGIVGERDFRRLRRIFASFWGRPAHLPRLPSAGFYDSKNRRLSYCRHVSRSRSRIVS